MHKKTAKCLLQWKLLEQPYRHCVDKVNLGKTTLPNNLQKSKESAVFNKVNNLKWTDCSKV